MERDLQIHPRCLATLRAELSSLIAHFSALGFEACELLFGWAWRESERDPEPSWKIIRTPLAEVEREIRKEEEAGLGEFGRDDVWLLVGGKRLRIRFCPNSGIHVFSTGPEPLADPFFRRWDAAGLGPTEWEKAPDRPGWTLLRGTCTWDPPRPWAPADSAPSWKPCP
jgi:hypothetical protein